MAPPICSGNVSQNLNSPPSPKRKGLWAEKAIVQLGHASLCINQGRFVFAAVTNNPWNLNGLIAQSKFISNLLQVLWGLIVLLMSSPPRNDSGTQVSLLFCFSFIMNLSLPLRLSTSQQMGEREHRKSRDHLTTLVILPLLTFHRPELVM